MERRRAYPRLESSRRFQRFSLSRLVDPNALAHCRANLVAAGVEGAVAVEHADVLTRGAPAAAGVIVSNPPYGVRIASATPLAEFYPRLGDALKQRFSGWTAHLLSADRDLARLIGLKPSRKVPLFNGALECRLYEYRLVAGSMRAGASDARAQ